MRFRHWVLILLVPTLLVVLIMFGTDYVMDFEYSLLDYSSLYNITQKEYVLRAEEEKEKEETSVPVSPSKPSTGMLGSHPVEYMLLSCIFESQGNPAGLQGHYNCGFQFDCSNEQSKVSNAYNSNVGDAIGMVQFDYNYSWYGKDGIIAKMVSTYPDDFGQFDYMINLPARDKTGQQPAVLWSLHRKMCEVRDRDYAGFAGMQADLAYDKYLRPAIKGLSEITDNRVNESNLSKALGATMLSVEIRNTGRFIPNNAKIVKGLKDFHNRLKSCGDDQRAMIEACYDYMLTIRKTKADAERYAKERVIALDMFDNPDFDPYASRTKNNEVTAWKYSQVGFGHCLGMEGY